MDDLSRKYSSLKHSLSSFDKLAVAFSGGVDSTLLAAVAVNVLGKDNVLLVTVKTAFVPQVEIEEAVEIAESLHVSQAVVNVAVNDITEISCNPPDRCYYCKKAVLSAIIAEARLAGFKTVADGSNADDVSAPRPGLKAAHELGIVSPLADARLSRDDVRRLSRDLGLPTAEKPSFSCLATRIPYGKQLEPVRLDRVEAAETALRPLFPKGVRVRDYMVQSLSGPMPLARLELHDSYFDVPLNVSLRRRITDILHGAGYAHVTVDLEGLRSGSMDL
ncbi:MAG: ATP-dependent sacrificial sulfur transferase LarE [Planctomycetes bacterium]|nr:ATP-dependent sacrificial sulfur transferase LarE [Planctomycetota bacterium]